MNAIVASHRDRYRIYVGATRGDQIIKNLAFCAVAAIGLSVSQSVRSLDLDDVSRELVSLREDGTQISLAAGSPSLSRYGERVAFYTQDARTAKGSSRFSDIYVRDRAAGTTFLVSYGKDGPADGDSLQPSISLNGDHVAYSSSATNLLCSGCDTNGAVDVYLHDIVDRSTQRISESPLRTDSETDGVSTQPSVSQDGNRVAFTSWASNLVSGDTNAHSDVFVWDQYKGIKRVSLSTQGNQLSRSSHSPRISADGRYVVFVAEAELGQSHVLVRDIDADTTLRVSEESDLTVVGHNREPSISEQGHYISWVSDGYLRRGEQAPYRVFVRNMFGYTICALSGGCAVENPITWQLNNEPGEQYEPQIYAQPGFSTGTVGYLPSIGVVYTSRSKEGRHDVVVQNDGPAAVDDHIVTVSSGEFGEAANGHSIHPTAWGTGTTWHIAFETDATNLVFDENNVRDIVLAERLN